MSRDPAKKAAYQKRWRETHRDEAREYKRAWLAEWRSRFARTGEVPSHSRTGYEIGCRCRICRTENYDYYRPYRVARRAAAKAAEFDWEGDGS